MPFLITGAPFGRLYLLTSNQFGFLGCATSYYGVIQGILKKQNKTEV